MTAATNDGGLRDLRAGDAALIVDHRQRMFAATGRYDASTLQSMSAAFAEWLPPRLGDGRYFGWLIEVDGEVAASLGMMWLDWPPHPLHRNPGRGYLLNLFVEPAHRRAGLARRLVQRSLDAAKAAGVDAVILHPTAEAVALYQSLGFVGSNEMIRLSASPSG